MLRAFLVVSLIVAVLAAGVFVPRLLKTAGPDRTESVNEACNLLEEECQWPGESGAWAVKLESRSVDRDGYRLIVETPVEVPRILAVLRGESMYMGEYPVLLNKIAERRYEGTFEVPFCSTGDQMSWRIDLQESASSAPMNENLMVFQAGHQ